MQDLNKNQLILLTLLVSFVTSIATGIITTSLLQQAPPGVTQVINRVVEKTIEQVATEGGKEIIREVTVVVKEEDQVVDAIAKNSKSIARITDNAFSDGVQLFYGIGILVDKDGIVVSARTDSINQGSTYTAVFGDGASYQLRVRGVDATNNLVVFEVAEGPKNPLKTSAVNISTSEPQLGQSVITIDGRDKNVISIGRITAINKSSSDSKGITSIETDITVPVIAAGAPFLNLSGEIIGIRVSMDGVNQVFIPAEKIKEVSSKKF